MAESTIVIDHEPVFTEVGESPDPGDPRFRLYDADGVSVMELSVAHDGSFYCSIENKSIEDVASERDGAQKLYDFLGAALRGEPVA